MFNEFISIYLDMIHMQNAFEHEKMIFPKYIRCAKLISLEINTATQITLSSRALPRINII